MNWHYLDITTLFVQGEGTPVGISRVLLELCRYCLGRDDLPVRFCRYEKDVERFVLVPNFQLAHRVPALGADCIAMLQPGRRPPQLGGPHPKPAGRRPPAFWQSGCDPQGRLEPVAILHFPAPGRVAFSFSLPASADPIGLDIHVDEDFVARIELRPGETHVSPAIDFEGDAPHDVIFVPGDRWMAPSEETAPPGDDDLQIRFEGFELDGAFTAGADVVNLSAAAFDRQTAPQLASPKTIFPAGSTLVIGGLPWTTQAMYRVYNIQQHRPLKLKAICHDIIPVILPQLCPDAMPDTFGRYLADLCWCEPEIYCVSDTTLNDIKAYIASAGLPVPRCSRIVLGDTVDDDCTPRKAGPLADLEPGQFLLCVGTIEPRKNHDLLFRLWHRMLRDSPDIIVPLLCIGKRGWRRGEFLQSVALNRQLSPQLFRLVRGLDDDELAWAYENCAFTLYPSFYEGWGLPIVESLAHGKLCVASDIPTSREAGQGLVELIDPDDLPRWQTMVTKLLRDRKALARRNRRIKRRYRKARWADTFAPMFEAGPAAEAE